MAASRSAVAAICAHAPANVQRSASAVIVGTAWPVAAESGWDVLGIDFSHEALNAARAILGPAAARVRHADFFAPIAGEPFEVVYERAFLCALPRRLWGDWAKRMAEVVAPGGLVAGFFFFGDGERGPPFPLAS